VTQIHFHKLRPLRVGLGAPSPPLRHCSFGVSPSNLAYQPAWSLDSARSFLTRGFLIPRGFFFDPPPSSKHIHLFIVSIPFKPLSTSPYRLPRPANKVAFSPRHQYRFRTLTYPGSPVSAAARTLSPSVMCRTHGLTGTCSICSPHFSLPVSYQLLLPIRRVTL
jgi:hypothetical protein